MIKTKLMAVCLLVGCSQISLAEQIYKDPYENYNRAMFNVNDHLDRYIMTPVAKGYHKITPTPVRTGVSNFFNNLRDVVSFGSNLLRFDIEKASTDFVRVGINTTFGLGGLLDIAGAGQIPNNKNTLGDTFATWGWKNSNYFVYPLLGPSTIRDSIGSTITYVFPVQNTIFKDTAVRWSVSVLSGVSTREALLDVTNSLDDAALDRYAYTRDIFMRLRNNQVGGSLYAVGSDDSDDSDDIDSLVPVGDDRNNTVKSVKPTVKKSSAITSHNATESTITEQIIPDQNTASTTISAAEIQPYWIVK